MYYLNKLVGLITSPVFVAMAMFVLAFIVALSRWTRAVLWIAGVSVVWCLFWASPATYRWLASGLEREFPVMKAEDAPNADAIMVLGGGMGSNTNAYPYSEMWTNADRAWHGARLYKAGKAPRVFVTCDADIPLLVDLGVPRTAICGPSGAKNTEEEAKGIVRLFDCSDCLTNKVQQQEIEQSTNLNNRTILLVTSAWHMRRAKLMFEKYAKGVEVIPAATDYEALVRCNWSAGFDWSDLLPNAEMIFLNTYMIHEIIGYWGYRWWR